MLRGGFVRNTKCPKCSGSLFLDSDGYGWYEQCLQCGCTSHLGKLVEISGEKGNKYLTEDEKDKSKEVLVKVKAKTH